jgi:hypothetical protein
MEKDTHTHTHTRYVPMLRKLVIQLLNLLKEKYLILKIIYLKKNIRSNLAA